MHVKCTVEPPCSCIMVNQRGSLILEDEALSNDNTQAVIKGISECRCVLISRGSWSFTVYIGVLISVSWNRGIPLYNYNYINTH